MNFKLFRLCIFFIILLLFREVYGQVTVEYKVDITPKHEHIHIHYLIADATDGLGKNNAQETDIFIITVQGNANYINEVKLKVKGNGEGKSSLSEGGSFSYNGFTATLIRQ